MEKIYNKLVRDNIVDIINNDGEIPITRVLTDEEYRVELYRKLREECEEVMDAKTKSDIMEELADILEILKAISELNGENLDSVIDVANKKREKRGGFSKRIFLERTFLNR